MLLLTSLVAHAEVPAYAGVGLGMGAAGPIVGLAGVVTLMASLSDKPAEAMTAEDRLEPPAARARRYRVKERWAVAGGSAAIIGVVATIAGPPLLLTGGLVGSGERSQIAGWVGVGLYGTALTAAGVAVAAQDDDAVASLVAAAGIAYVGSMVAGGVQLAMSGAGDASFVLPLAAGRF